MRNEYSLETMPGRANPYLPIIESEKLSKYFRVVIELSNMINNNERVSYNLGEPDPDLGRMEHRVRISRPVLLEEIRQGIDIRYHGDKHEEKAPKITLLMDSLWMIVDQAGFWSCLSSSSFSSFIAHEAAYNYYDCMTGGCPHYYFLLLAHLCTLPGVNLKEPVYPGKESCKGLREYSRIKGQLNKHREEGGGLEGEEVFLKRLETLYMDMTFEEQDLVGNGEADPDTYGWYILEDFLQDARSRNGELKTLSEIMKEAKLDPELLVSGFKQLALNPSKK